MTEVVHIQVFSLSICFWIFSGLKRLYLLELEELELLLQLQVKQQREKQTLVPPSRPVDKEESPECAPQKAVLSQEPSALFHHNGPSLACTAAYIYYLCDKQGPDNMETQVLEDGPALSIA